MHVVCVLAFMHVEVRANCVESTLSFHLYVSIGFRTSGSVIFVKASPFTCGANLSAPEGHSQPRLLEVLQTALLNASLQCILKGRSSLNQQIETHIIKMSDEYYL